MSVYRYSPPAVGFAALSGTASTLATASLPTPTVGADTISPTRKGTGGASSLMLGARGWARSLGHLGVVTMALGVTSSLVLGVSFV